jgi:hypothetical protein
MSAKNPAWMHAGFKLFQRGLLIHIHCRSRQIGLLQRWIVMETLAMPVSKKDVGSCVIQMAEANIARVVRDILVDVQHVHLSVDADIRIEIRCRSEARVVGQIR